MQLFGKPTVFYHNSLGFSRGFHGDHPSKSSHSPDIIRIYPISLTGEWHRPLQNSTSLRGVAHTGAAIRPMSLRAGGHTGVAIPWIFGNISKNTVVEIHVNHPCISVEGRQSGSSRSPTPTKKRGGAASSFSFSSSGGDGSDSSCRPAWR